MEAIIPVRHRPHRKNEPVVSLSPAQSEFNRRLSPDRVLVENYYARLKRLFGILYSNYRCGLNSMETLVHTCVALNNFLISKHPMRLSTPDIPSPPSPKKKPGSKK